MSSRSDDARGSISAFVVCVAGSLALLGLTILENGRLATEYLRVSDVAENAARMAGQNVVGIREGNPHIDSVAARRTALAYMNREGVSGTVAVTGSGFVQVHASVSVPAPGLSVLGITIRRITLVRTSRTLDG